jgi:dolichol-phosphate mannosyltransferase
METRKILVTGANGFVGANLCRYFASFGYEVYGLVRNASDNRKLDSIKHNLNIVKLGEFKVDNLHSLFKSINPDVVFNAIGADQKDFLNDYEGNWNSNFITLVKLVSALRDIPLDRFVHAGSSFEYGNVSSAPSLLKETLECNPVSDYGISKLMQSEYLKYASKLYSLPITVLRIFNVYGPYESKKRLIPQVILNALKDDKIIILNPNIARDFIYMDDVNAAFHASIKKPSEALYSVFNIGTGKSTSVLDIVKHVVSITKSKSEIEYGKGDLRPENKLSSPFADISLANRDLDWMPSYSVEDGLKSDIDWFKNNLEYYENL